MTRIIAGEARGRTIKVPTEGTRPTADRAREGLFHPSRHVGALPVLRFLTYLLVPAH